RWHERAARAVLQALLPEAGTDIRGRVRPRAELLAASGYAGRPADFEELLRILDARLRLITPADAPGGQRSEKDPSSLTADVGRAEVSYQLTHDYLVGALRRWLTARQRGTMRGRAELQLAEQAALWAARPLARHLPSLPEWLGALALTRRRDWTGPQ